MELTPNTTKQFNLPGGNACSVTMSPGSLEVREAEDDMISVTCLVREGAEDTYRFSVEEGDELVLRGKETKFSWVDRRARMRISLPKKCALTVALMAGSAQIEKISGKLNIDTDGGSIDVQHAESAVIAKAAGGRIDIAAADKAVTAETLGGSIRIGAVGGKLAAQAAGGSIEAHLGAKPSGSASTRGGSVRLFADQSAAFTFKASVSGGRIRIAEPFSDQQSDSSNVEVKIGENGRATFTASASGGNVVLEATDARAGRNLPRGVRANRDTLAAAPQIEGPDTHERSADTPPVFRVSPGAGRFWGIELATDPVLFNANLRPENTPVDRFFASWVNGLSVSSGETNFELDPRVWKAMRDADRLYYRIVTSAQPEAWKDAATSSAAAAVDAIPYFEIN